MKKDFIKKLTGITLSLTVLLSSTVVANADTPYFYNNGKWYFSDVTSSHWACDQVRLMFLKGGINGYPDGTFRPGNTITCSEFIKTAIACTTKDKIEKTGKHWASGYISYALDKGILLDSEMPDDKLDTPMTRQMMATVISRISENILNEELTKAQSSQIKDYNKINDEFKEDILKVYGEGLITGYEDGTFGPLKTATRAEATTMLSRCISDTQRILTEEERAKEEAKLTWKSTVTDIINDKDRAFAGRNQKSCINYWTKRGFKYAMITDGSLVNCEYLGKDMSIGTVTKTLCEFIDFSFDTKNIQDVYAVDKNGDVVTTVAILGSPTVTFTAESLAKTEYVVFECCHARALYVLPADVLKAEVR